MDTVQSAQADFANFQRRFQSLQTDRGDYQTGLAQGHPSLRTDRGDYRTGLAQGHPSLRTDRGGYRTGLGGSID